MRDSFIGIVLHGGVIMCGTRYIGAYPNEGLMGV